MAVPTISAVAPSRVHTGGRCLVQITGTNFRVPPLPPAGLGRPADPIPAGVEVLIGGVPALRTMVLTATRLLVHVPPSPIAVTRDLAYGEGAVDVTVRNLDDAGVLIPGETVTATDALDYRRVQLADDSDLKRLVHALICMLRRETIANVQLTAHTDFDSDFADGAQIVDLAELPGLAIMGPTLAWSPQYAQDTPSALAVVDPGHPGELFAYRPARPVDLAFGIVGVSDNPMELLNLQALVEEFFNRNPWIELQRDPTDANAGFARYELAFAPDGDLRDASQANVSNLRSFSGNFVIRGFSLDGVAGFALDAVISKTALTDEVGARLSTEALTDP